MQSADYYLILPTPGNAGLIDGFRSNGRREVQTLVSGLEQAGRHTTRWDAANHAGRRLPAGIYYYRLKGDLFLKTKKMVLIP
ncbi:MAG: FlgD immunoglobulin-like domain containing protein [Planctomycetota bacterium]